MTKDEALRLALEALEWQQEMLYTAMQYSAAKGMTFLGHPPNPNEAITAIKAVLDAPQRTWVGLTDDEIVLIVAECAASHQHTDIHFAKAIEAKLKEKNHA
jgi:hypothetical protein